MKHDFACSALTRRYKMTTNEIQISSSLTSVACRTTFLTPKMMLKLVAFAALLAATVLGKFRYGTSDLNHLFYLRSLSFLL